MPTVECAALTKTALFAGCEEHPVNTVAEVHPVHEISVSSVWFHIGYGTILLSSAWPAAVPANVIVWAVELVWVVVTENAVPPDADTTVTDVVGRVPAG